jgi:hypothetical protein
MEEPAEPTYQQAMQRKLGQLRQMRRQTTNLIFVASLLLIAAFILYFIPVSGVALLITSSGAFVCLLAAIVLRLRAHVIETQALKQVDAYRAVLNLPRLEKASSQADTWTDHLLRWCFRLLTGLTFLLIFGELALLWQEQPSLHQQLMLLGVMVFTAAGGVVGMWVTSPSKPQRNTKEGG